MIDPTRPYKRIEIDKVFTKIKSSMHDTALIEGKAKGFESTIYQDCYTGKTLIGGDSYDYEHIRSSEEIHTKYKHTLTDDEIAIVVNCSENVAVTLRSINLSKGNRRMEDWISNSENIVKNDIDLKLTLINLKKADEGIEKAVKNIHTQIGC